MAFYSHPPIQLYAAYTPMAIPNQPEFYAVYPPGTAAHPAIEPAAFYYDAPKGGVAQHTGRRLTPASLPVCQTWSLC